MKGIRYSMKCFAEQGWMENQPLFSLPMAPQITEFAVGGVSPAKQDESGRIRDLERIKQEIENLKLEE